MNRYVITGIFGLASGFIAALADVPLVMPGKDSDQMPGIKDQYVYRMLYRITVPCYLLHETSCLSKNLQKAERCRNRRCSRRIGWVPSSPCLPQYISGALRI